VLNERIGKVGMELEKIASGYNLDKIQSNFDKIEEYLNDHVAKRVLVGGESNVMQTFLDMNQNRIVNASHIVSAADLDAALAILEDMRAGNA